MKNRNSITRKLEQLESNITKMTFLLNNGDREGCYSNIENIKEQIEQIKLYIESEPIDGYEMNN